MAPVVEGFWGKQTATIDWCEDNYVVSYYVAEFWNTVSNAVMIFSPLLMVFFGYKENHEKRFTYSFMALAVVGIGSWLFHMTLRYSMQLMDELPMIWGTSFLVYSLYMIDSKPEEENVTLQLLLLAYCVIVTLVYILINAPIFHQICYALMVFGVVCQGTKVFLTTRCSRTLYLVAFFSYAFGFLMWNVDNIYCPHLRSIRDQPVGKSSGMLFECHAWWHIFAGIGTYLGILFSIHARYMLLRKSPKVKLLFGCWPYVSIAEDAFKLQ